MDINDSSSEDDVQINTPQLHDIEDEDLLAEIDSPALPNLLELLNEDAQKNDDAKPPRLANPQEWRDRIQLQSQGHVYNLDAHNTEDAALAWIAMLTELTRGCNPREYKAVLLTTCQIEDRCALLSPVGAFGM